MPQKDYFNVSDLQLDAPALPIDDGTDALDWTTDDEFVEAQAALQPEFQAYDRYTMDTVYLLSSVFNETPAVYIGNWDCPSLLYPSDPIPLVCSLCYEDLDTDKAGGLCSDCGCTSCGTELVDCTDCGEKFCIACNNACPECHCDYCGETLQADGTCPECDDPIKSRDAVIQRLETQIALLEWHNSELKTAARKDLQSVTAQLQDESLDLRSRISQTLGAIEYCLNGKHSKLSS